MEMNMDQKQKQISGSRFNIFDFLIIVGIVVCLAAIAARILFIGNEKKNVVYADVYFEISGISEVTAEAISVPNESIYLQSNDIRIGVMNETQTEAQKVLTDNGEGVLVEALHPEKKTVYGMAQIKGVWYEEGFMVDEAYLATVGSSLEIYTQYASCTITITSITPKQ